MNSENNSQVGCWRDNKKLVKSAQNADNIAHASLARVKPHVENHDETREQK